MAGSTFSIPTTTTPERVAVIGLGYVGCVSAACLSSLGHSVVGIDKDAHKVQSVLKGDAPFYEPGLEELIRAGRESGRLSTTTDLAEGLRDASIALICVGTPSERNGNMSLAQLRRVCDEIGLLLAGRTSPLIVTIRSTVFPGTCEDVASESLRNHPMGRVVSNPEFLREGTAVKDFLEPSLLVVGGTDDESARRVANLYAGLPVSACLVSLRTAEMIKYACNAFHAVKISFANEIGAIAGRLGVNPEEVMSTLCQDVKLNVSPAYLKPGFAFGGSCLPKDLRAIVYRSHRLDVKLPMLEAVLPSNDAHLHRAIEASLALPGPTLAVFGLAFKENTDDLRESPVITLLEQLLAKGRNIRVFDPHIRMDQIYGSNLNFLVSSLPHIGRLMVGSLDELLEGGDQIIIAQNPGKAEAARLAAAGKPILDLTRIPA